MDFSSIVLIAIVAVPIVAVLIYLGHLHEKKRQAALQRLATELGWDFDIARDSRFDQKHPHFGVFQRGHSRYAHNLLRGNYASPLEIVTDDGQPVTLKACGGDYHYKITRRTGKNSSTTTYRFSYLIIKTPTAAGQDLTIRPEHFGDKMTAALGFDDIDFESVEFSDRYHVKSRDKRFAYDLFHPRMMQYLLDDPSPKLHIAEGYLCIADGKRWDPQKFRQHLNWLVSFYALWPRHLIES